MKPTIDRRRLILAAFATGCFASLTPEALAQIRRTARAAGHPLLTQASLARAIPGPGARNYNFEMQAAADDLEAYLRARFTLTAAQQEFLGNMTVADKLDFRQHLLNAMAQRQQVSVELQQEELRGGCEGVRVQAGSTVYELQNRGLHNAERGNQAELGPIIGTSEPPVPAPQQTPR